MPKSTISYRIASEVAGIDVDGVRYRATRSSRMPTTRPDGTPGSAGGPWTLWHDDRDGGAHTVGHTDAYDAVEQAAQAAADHEQECHR